MTNQTAFHNVKPASLPWAQQPTLTKREMIAAMALLGLLADSITTGSLEDIAKDAVDAADILIAQLEEDKPHA